MVSLLSALSSLPVCIDQKAAFFLGSYSPWHVDIAKKNTDTLLATKIHQAPLGDIWVKYLRTYEPQIIWCNPNMSTSNGHPFCLLHSVDTEFRRVTHMPQSGPSFSFSPDTLGLGALRFWGFTGRKWWRPSLPRVTEKAFFTRVFTFIAKSLHLRSLTPSPRRAEKGSRSEAIITAICFRHTAAPRWRPVSS